MVQGPVVDIVTRSADIRRPTKQTPLSMTTDTDDNVHPEDFIEIPGGVAGTVLKGLHTFYGYTREIPPFL